MEHDDVILDSPFPLEPDPDHCHYTLDPRFYIDPHADY